MNQDDRESPRGKSREVTHFKNLLKNIPNERLDKVRTLKNGINAGSYKVNVEKVAEKIIERTLKTAIHSKRNS